MTDRELLDTAQSHLSELTTVKEPDFRLEQAVFDKKEMNWEIVVSYLIDDPSKRSLFAMKLDKPQHYTRIYKEMKIDENNEVVGFYMYSETA